MVNSRLSDQYETVQWSPDGNTVLLGGRRTLIIEANLFSRTLYDIKGMSSSVFSPDGVYLATAWDQIVLHSPKDGSSILPLDGAAERPERLSFSPDSKTLASLSKIDGTIIFWKVPSG